MTVVAKATTHYPTGNDSTTRISATGSASGDAREIDPDETDQVLTPATLLDEKVKQLIESAGARFNYKEAVANGTMLKVAATDDITDALRRLEKAAPLLNAAVVLAQRRAAHMTPLERMFSKAARGSASGSRSGSQSGSPSGSESGSERGEMSKALVERYLAGDREAGLELMRLR